MATFYKDEVNYVIYIRFVASGLSLEFELTSTRAIFPASSLRRLSSKSME
jgi:hypothetical protein